MYSAQGFQSYPGKCIQLVSYNSSHDLVVLLQVVSYSGEAAVLMKVLGEAFLRGGYCTANP